MRRHCAPPSRRSTTRRAERLIWSCTRPASCSTAIRGASPDWKGARSFYSQLWAAFPDARLSVEDVIAEDDRVAARYRLSGVQARDFYGAPVTGESAEMEGMAWLRFQDGRAVEVWQASGTLDTLTRLAARASQAPQRPSASAEAAALRWEERQEQ